MPAANFQAIDVNHRVQRMEFSVDVFVGVLDSFHVFDDVQRLDEIDVDAGRVADESENQLIDALRLMDGDALADQPVLQVVQLLLVRIFFQDDNHVCGSFLLIWFKWIIKHKKNRRRLFAGGLGFFGSWACRGQTAVVKKDLFAAKSYWPSF